MSLSFLTCLTIFVCILCLVFFIWARVSFQSKINKLNTDVNKYLTDQTIDESKTLNKDLSNYLSSLNKNNYSTEYASNYISIDSLSISYNFKLKILTSIPNILTGIGILGTFLGLSVALYEFDSSDSEAIRVSINSLLEGMSTAFWTSVTGMITSARFLYWERRIINKTENNIENLCSALDKKHHKSLDQIIIDSFTHTEENETITPAESFRLIIDSVKKMKTTLEIFGTDLCDSIGNAMDDSFEDKLVPIINNLATRLENPAQVVTDGLICELKNICESFKNNLTQDVDQQMDELLERFIDASNAINNVPDILEDVRKKYKESSYEVVESHRAISESFDNQVIKITNLSNSLSESIEKITESFEHIEVVNQSLTEIQRLMKQASEAIDFSSKNLMRTNDNTTEALSTIKIANTKVAESVQEYVNNISKIQSGLSLIFNDINIGLTKYVEGTRNGLQNMLNPFTTSISDATIKIANSIVPLNDAVEGLSIYSDAISKSLKELSETITALQTSIKR